MGVLKWAAKHGHASLDNGVTYWKTLRSLHTAALHGRSEATRVLLELGTDMAIINQQKAMPAHLAARGSVSCLQAFIDARFALNTEGPNYAEVPHFATHHASIEMVGYFLGKAEMKMAINARNFAGYTPLHLAILNSEIVKLLLPHGADMEVQDCYRRTPTHCPACGGIRGLDSESLKTLTDSGSALSIRADNGQTVLLYAAESINHKR